MQLWRNEFFWIADIEHLRNWKRHRHNSFTLAIYSTRAIIWRLISIFAQKKPFSKISRKVVCRCKRLDEQNSDQFSKSKYLLQFLRYRRKCANQKINSICRAGLNYDVIIAIMMLCIFFESLTSKISGTERDTEIILSLLKSTRQRLSSRVLFQ